MTPREFFKKWGEGIQNITPLQLIFQQLIGQTIVLVGIVLGLCVTFIYHQWWIFVILCGSLFVAGSSYIGMLQKYSILKKFMNPIEEKKKEVSYV